ncbi:hypothetical protein [Lacunisphaera limnophila]|uniref:hypothetical protein n=1 Tax=Lacunisphaera limnophila TaxID=1838286 RepID=UPI0012FE55B8|nr:hypothetical protein [Lacunisphaera limnophila]
MKPKENSAQRECLFSKRYSEEGEEVFVGLYRIAARLLLVTSKERGGDIEVELSHDDARKLIDALGRETSKEADPPR